MNYSQFSAMVNVFEVFMARRTIPMIAFQGSYVISGGGTNKEACWELCEIL